MLSRYDDEAFFSEYAKMERSLHGLSSAGEWHQLKAMIPDLEGKGVLDLGCGYGWHSKFAAENGALKVLGIDSSPRMIHEAERRNPDDRIDYIVCSIEDYDYPENTWDFVISNLVLHYVDSLSDVYRGVYRTLKPSGEFLFNIEHPSFTSGVNQEWIYDENGKIVCWPIDNYFYPGIRNTDFLGFDVAKYHHTLTQILMGLIDCGFEIKAVEEAMPSEEMLDVPGMIDEMRRPMMLIVKAVANK